MRADYKEQAVRVDFIDPFFEALGWDVNHKHQRDPFKREVEAERSEKERRVDYSFHWAPITGHWYSLWRLKNLL